MALGGLYFQRNHFVESAKNYEKALEGAKDGPRKNNLLFQVAKIHTDRTGRYERAEELLVEFVKPIDGQDPSDTEARASWIKVRFQVYIRLAEVYQKTRRRREAGLALRKALEIHQQLEDLIAKQNELITKAFRKLQDSKKPLKNETLERELNIYNRNKDDYEREKTLLGQLYAIRNSLPLKNVYFDLARYFEEKHFIDKAFETYRAAELAGIAPDQARRQMQRLRTR